MGKCLWGSGGWKGKISKAILRQSVSCVSRGRHHVFLMPGAEQRPTFLWRMLNEHASYQFCNDGKRLVGV